MKRRGRLCLGGGSTATRQKAAKAINLIIVFSMFIPSGEKTPNRYARLDASAVGIAPGGKDRREQTTSSLDGGATDENDVGCNRKFIAPR